MPDPHWENLKEIFHAAVALAPDERSAYLDRACDGDAALRRAVESLVKSHEETGFVDQPAYQAAAEMLMQDRKLNTGHTVGRYRIVSLIGEGGMGQVYLAEDTKLHRKVSLKFLTTSVTRSEEHTSELQSLAYLVCRLLLGTYRVHRDLHSFPTRRSSDLPAYQAAAEMLMQDRKLNTGHTVGRYRIVSLIGEGGMGQVYLAEDTKLHRKVSLKFLTTSVT